MITALALVPSRALALPSSLEVGGGLGISWVGEENLHLRYAVDAFKVMQFDVRGLYEGTFGQEDFFGESLDHQIVSQWAVAADARAFLYEVRDFSLFVEVGAGAGQVVRAGCGESYPCYEGGLTPYARGALGFQLAFGCVYASLEGELDYWSFMHEKYGDSELGQPPPTGPTDGSVELSANLVASVGIKFGR